MDPPGTGSIWRRWTPTSGIEFAIYEQPKISFLSFTYREELEEAFRLFDREGDGQIETQVLVAITETENEKTFGRS